MVTLHDDLGGAVDLPRSPRRVVSLVPSLTESIASVDPDLLVGVTDWCTHPADLDVERIRGTKNPNVRRIVELAPDLVIANKEENRRTDIQLLRAAGIPVWVTVTETVPAALDSLHRLFEQVLGLPTPDWLAAADTIWRPAPPTPWARVAIPIWRDPWMVVGNNTFTGDLATRLGLVNVFHDTEGRYPHVDLDVIVTARPDLVLLPDEPYVFTATDGPEAFPTTTRTALVRGRLLTWYGPSLATARDDLLAGLR